jgi:uncharacterized protein
MTMITRDEAVRRLRDAEPEIRLLGVHRLALFASALRDQAKADTAVDLLVEFAPGAKSFDRFLALTELLEEVMGRRVDVVTKEGLSPYFGPRILAEVTEVLRGE